MRRPWNDQVPLHEWRVCVYEMASLKAWLLLHLKSTVIAEDCQGKYDSPLVGSFHSVNIVGISFSSAGLRQMQGVEKLHIHGNCLVH